MEHRQKGMERRWERHYPTTRSTIAAGCMLFGCVMGICLAAVWPQYLSKQIFNSRLAYHLIMDLEDHWTCDKDYIKFIIDEPTEDTTMFQFWLFNVSNAADIIDRGYKPLVKEVGPYGFRKKTYKYDVYFDPVDSLYVTYSEYTMLEEIKDNPQACQKQYGRMDRHYLASVDKCLDGSCNCRSTNDTLTIINPVFLKTIHDESTHDMLGQLSSAVYIEIKRLLENDFVHAVRAHLVKNALQEVYLFRNQMQIGVLLNTMVEFFLARGNSLKQIANMWTANSTANIPADCGLGKYFSKLNSDGSDVTTISCPMNGYTRYNIPFKALMNAPEYKLRGNYTASDFPSLESLFDVTVPYSLLNTTSGLPNWLGLAWQMGFIKFNLPDEYTLLVKGGSRGPDGDMWVFQMNVVDQLCVQLVGMKNYDTCRHLAAAQVLNVMYWLAPFYDLTIQYGVDVSKVLSSLVYQEFMYTSDQVQCAPGFPVPRPCVWQWGYMSKLGNNYALSKKTAKLLIDINDVVDTNPTHIFFSKNAASYYNAHTYCTKVLPFPDLDAACSDLDYCKPAVDVNASYIAEGPLHSIAVQNMPAAFYAVQKTGDTTKAKDRFGSLATFRNLHTDQQNIYVQAVCNMSALIHSVYPTQTSFHDDYVIAYINNAGRRDPLFTHQFSKANWKEVGWAQFGSGVVTDLLTSVRAIYQVTRDAMWRFGPYNYYYNLIEFSTWSIKTGYPTTFIYNVDDARALLYALSDITDEGKEFRRKLAYTGTTLIGDGVNIINGVGAVGDVAFTPESNLGNFNCTGKFKRACTVLSPFYASSYKMCLSVEAMYTKCKLQAYSGNVWVANCPRLQTSLTSPLNGIQCDQFVVYGKKHPYVKSRGSVLYEMMHSLTNTLRLKTGLWCQNPDLCPYNWGGIVTTTKVKKVLFEGYTEPTVLQYLNLKHANDGITLRCNRSAILSVCAVPGTEFPGSYICDNSGLVMGLPHQNQSKVLAFGITPHDEYFAPYFEVVADTGELLWSYSMDPTTVKRASVVKATGTRVIKMQNPNWAAYPAWNTPDAAFNKFYQCQKRYYSGMPFKFNSCVNRLNTGRTDVTKTMDLQVFQGNSSIYWFDTPAVVNGSFNQEQAPMSLWDGFFAYPYSYNFSVNGSLHQSMTRPRIFHKTHPFNFVLDESQFVYPWEFNIDLSVPVCTSFSPCVGGREEILRTRKFEESIDTWLPLKSLGVPRDSYGMPYKIPIGMASLERLAGFPVYAGTPHSYGNKLWGGFQFDDVSGYEQKQANQRTFIDYDPVTGRIQRTAVRQAVNIRVEANPLVPNLFSSQGRCIAPTKAFTYGSGYGCFCYIPLLWYEDGRVVETNEFYRRYDHFYRRPDRALLLQTVGIAVGAVFFAVGLLLYLYEAYHSRQFYSRVYVD